MCQNLYGFYLISMLVIGTTEQGLVKAFQFVHLPSTIQEAKLENSTENLFAKAYINIPNVRICLEHITSHRTMFQLIYTVFFFHNYHPLLQVLPLHKA